MITLYCFGEVHPAVKGETRDLRAQWALEECGLPYQIHGVDHTAGEHQGKAYTTINDFQLLPAIEDDGLAIAESGAIVLYVAEKSGKLIPHDFQGRMKVTQWCFSALSTVERPLLEIQLIDKFGYDTQERREKMVKEATRWLVTLERRLENSQWIASSEFSVADILLASVLREIRHTDLLIPYPHLKSYYERAMARPAWKRTLESYSDRLNVTLASIQ